MQPPIEKVLGEDFHLTPSGAMSKVKDCFYYVPLLSSLQAMLNQKEIKINRFTDFTAAMQIQYHWHYTYMGS